MSSRTQPSPRRRRERARMTETAEALSRVGHRLASMFNLQNEHARTRTDQSVVMMRVAFVLWNVETLIARALSTDAEVAWEARRALERIHEDSSRRTAVFYAWLRERESGAERKAGAA